MNIEYPLLIGVTSLLWLGLTTTGLASAQGAAHVDPARIDTHSLSNPHEVRTRNLDLDLTLDFDKREIQGVAILDFERAPGCPADARLVLDTRGLTIEEVGLRARSNPTALFEATRFQLGQADPILGSRLAIELAPAADQARIVYRTSANASALQWLPPGLTAGKAHPFLFTQSEAIHARSWIPLQDTPSVRVRYTATIHAPKGLTAVMAAESRVTPAEAEAGLFRFVMPQPIPSYLIALAAGDLAFQPLGARTGVWAEPSVLKKAAFEFADVEQMVDSVEKRFGPYRWGRYDILVLPPSFPFGGMENPG